ncbi:aldo/keto reductase [Nocardioides nematodiphilus]|uniref:aldo/keto reductase n=1 Tax=Nocardioides nematodiphilus TaxID=2849669 RepID=UPI001CDA39F6|nr:aldo/keto reductase [Nocardioides nematodiphilus]MCA1984216.1 aldo/keto reductase [Nocardioides nematodiphilus]
MATRVVLQSRLSSSRLPAKGMLSLAGMPVVVLAARRAANTGTDTVVATSAHPDDDVLASTVASAGVRVVRGSLHDPLARFIGATHDLADDDVVVRLTADNVFPDGALVDHLAGQVTAEAPYARIGGSAELDVPYGVAAEAFLVSALRAADREARTPYEREHVTPWIRSHLSDRQLEPPVQRPAWRGLRSTIDTFDDFVRASRVLGAVEAPVEVSWVDLCDRLAALEGPRPRLATRGGDELRQSVVILGAVQLGLPYGAANTSGMPDADEARAVLQAAAASGVSHVDTARVYGESEARVGGALRRGLSEQLGVVTKLRPLDEVPTDADPGWGRAAAEASIAESLRALDLDGVDALLVHRAADWSRPGVRDALVEARRAGRARRIGISLSAPDELLAVLGDPELGYVQLPFNLLDRRWLAPAVQDGLAARPDLLITVRSAYLQGLLTGGAQARWPANAGVDVAETMRIVDELVVALGRSSRADLALAYVLGHRWVSSVVVGAETPAQVRDTADLARREPLRPDEQELVRTRLPEPSIDLLDPSRWVTA